MRLELQNIEMKNFLSYGNTPQRLDFFEGINLILGTNLGSGRSNGAGKSSLIETIPFAWFGKLSRPIRKEGIVNWQNKKQCEVKITFKKGNVEYKILRAIKPDKLEIYENGSLLPIPSDVRTYQKQLENDILGMDYNTFMYLFYTNLNTNVPLLKMNTAQKRSFLERMFLLDTYTELNGLSNEKIKGLEEKIFKINVDVEHNNKTIFDLSRQNDTLRLKLIDITPYEKAIIEAEDEYNKKYKMFDPCLGDDLEQDIKQLNKLESNIGVLEFNNTSLSKRITLLKIQAEEHNKKISDIKKKIFEYDDISFDSFDSHIQELQDKINEDSLLQQQITSKIELLNERRFGKKSSYDSLKGGICPTCNKKVTEKQLQNHYIKEIKELDTQIELFHSGIKKISDKINTNSKLLEKLKEDRNEVRDKQKKRDSLKSSLETLEGIVVPTYELEEHTLKENMDKIGEFTDKCISIKICIESKKNLLREKEELLSLKSKIDNLKSELELRKSNRAEIKDIIKENDEKIEKIKKESKSASGSINKLKELVDYLSYLKILCKDENVKQFAISSYMSYLVQQTNFYLSKAGSSHYLKFNKWLEEEIHGVGVFDASYGNLSGGEARSIDLAIQFAFLDVAKIKTGIFPDVLLLDEILDSSIDGGGLANILKITQTKQHEDKSKVFIITHRTEITDVDVDNTYLISKNNGFSVIERM